MKGFGREIVKRSLMGIGVSSFLFLAVTAVFDLTGGGSFALDNYRMSKMALGSIICGIGWGAPSVVYLSDRFSEAARRLIHMGIGCVVYTVVAFLAGWFGTATSWWQKLLMIAFELAVAVCVWFVFHLYYRREARRINERIQEMK